MRLCDKRLYSTESTKYLGVKTDANLTWPVNHLIIKLNRPNALLFKIRKYIGPKKLRSIYFAIFKPHLSYSYLVWVHNFRTIQQIVILQQQLLESLISNQ